VGDALAGGKEGDVVAVGDELTLGTTAGRKTRGTATSAATIATAAAMATTGRHRRDFSLRSRVALIAAATSVVARTESAGVIDS
jgi:hypothetical protein